MGVLFIVEMSKNLLFTLTFFNILWIRCAMASLKEAVVWPDAPFPRDFKNMDRRHSTECSSGCLRLSTGGKSRKHSKQRCSRTKRPINSNTTVKVSPACSELPVPVDWMLASFSPMQIEESLMRACFAPNAPCHQHSEVLSMAPPEVQMDSEYFRNFVPVFENAASLRSESFYLVMLASPVTHLPVYGRFCNRGLSLHVFPGICYKPTTFRNQLRNALHRFLSSPDALVIPPEDSSGLREGQVPVRMFTIKLEDVCCPSSADRLCDNALQVVKHLYSRPPAFEQYPYTTSVYLATKGLPGSVDLACIGYQKRVFFMQIPSAFQPQIM